MTARPLLLVHGGDDLARRTFKHGYGDWSQALPVVLEKYGHLRLVEAVPEEVSNIDLDTFGCVLIASMPEHAWPQTLVDTVVDGARPCIVEKPPPPVARALGVTRAEPAGAEGTVTGRAPELRTRASLYGASPAGRVKPPAVRSMDYDARQHWSALPGVALTHEQAQAWAVPSWSFEGWEIDPSAEVWAEWLSEDSPRVKQPAVIRKGAAFGTAFELFAYLGQAHSSEPWPFGEFRSSPRTNGLEALLLALVDALHAMDGKARTRLLPWPDDRRWALNVRHDFDRPLEPDDVAGVLAAHERWGTASTWYWRSRYVARPQGNVVTRLRHRGHRARALRAVQMVARSCRHEVAHHTERLWAGADDEQSAIEAATGAAIGGTSAHGDPDCFRFQGAPNVLWANERGLLYTELIQRAHLHPHRFAAMDRRGHIMPLSVICLPHHESFDLSMKPGDTATERVLRISEVFVGAGGLLQVMNHPDLNVEELFATLAQLPHDGRWDCTAAEAADWWRRTHVAGVLDLCTPKGETAVAIADSPLGRASVEVLMPDGSRQVVPLESANRHQ